MNGKTIAVLFAAISLIGLTGSGFARPQIFPTLLCTCPLDSNFSPGGRPPDCVSSYGLTFGNAQDGICAHQVCPTEEKCTADLSVSVSAESGCEWEIDLDGGATAMGSGSGSVEIDLQLSCGNNAMYSFCFGGVDGGTFTVICNKCAL